MATDAHITGALTRAPSNPDLPHGETSPPNRRGILGAIVALPMVAAGGAMPAGATLATSDPHWSALVADFRTKHAIWLAAVPGEDACRDAFNDACAALPPKPQAPGSSLPDDILGMTLAEIRASSDAPAYQAAWRFYERDHAAWEEQHAALRQRIIGPAKAIYDETYAAYAAATDALAEYPVPTLAQLVEKIEIIVADYEGSEIPAKYIGAILADARRLAGEIVA